jgi:hypothetical protein
MVRSHARSIVVPAIALAACVAGSCGSSKFGSSSKKESRKEKVADSTGIERDGDGRVDETDAHGGSDKTGGDGSESGEGGRDSSSDGSYPGNAPDGRGEKLSTAAQAIVTACAKGPKIKQSFKIAFEAVKGTKEKPACTYVGGEVKSFEGKRDFIQGIGSQSKSVALPAGAVLCSQKIFSARSTEWVYDDEIVLTLNGVILATTQKKYLDYDEKPTFAKEAAGWLFSWDRLAARRMNNYQSQNPSDRYCYATDTSNCQMPFTQKEGLVNLELPTEALAPLSAKIQVDKKFELGLHVTGDDESDIDCQHSGIELTAELEYVK